MTASDGQWRFAPTSHVPARFAMCITQFEDRSFFQHHGVRPESLVRAFEQNRMAGHTVSGGSTLTMQVARLSRGGHRTYGNKLAEALLALWIELRYDKATILSLYATNAPFGGNVVGLEAAAWRWFGRSPDELSWADCATLAVLPNAPSDIYPGKGQEALRAKRNRLLDRLRSIHAIDRTEWALACDEPLPTRPHALPCTAPHLLTTLMKLGHDGERIHTTIDAHLQSRATEVSDRYAQRLRANEVHNAAALIVDVPSGHVLAYVGNLPSSGAEHAGSVDIVRAQRSTGSLLKPFLYADMLQSGELLPDMLVADVPTRYDGFSPRNFDESYAGAVPASEALSRSLNVPAVRELRKHGVDRTLRTLRAMGFASINGTPDHYGLSLIVGGAESSLWELVGAYASMGRLLRDHGRLGHAYQPGDVHPLQVLEEAMPRDTSTRVPLTAASIHFTLKALRELNRPEAEQGWKAFADRQHIAWKTGTSVGHRDAWAIGLSDRWCVAVWTGNASGEGRPGLTGTLAAAPLLFDLFALLPADAAPAPPYDEFARAPLCRASGQLAGMDCPVVDTVFIPREGLRTAACPYHLLVHVDESERSRVDAYSGHAVAWFHHPPARERYYLPRQPGYRPLPPMLNASNEDAIMEVLYPENGARLLIPTELDGTRGKAIIEVAHRDPSAVLHWDLDGTYLGHTSGEHRMALDPPEGPHRLTLTDQNGNVLRHAFTVVGRERDR
jgi:penicillin-binding protein 1C